jgi:hypothetical protein
MHDIDRIRLETQSETGMFEAGPFSVARVALIIAAWRSTARPGV